MEYHTLKTFISSSGLKLFEECPEYFWETLLKEKDKPVTRAMEDGEIIHAAVLEPERYEKNMVIKPKWSGEGARTFQKNWEAENADKIIVTQEQKEMVEKALQKIYEHPVARGVLIGGDREVSGFAREPKYGIGVRIRPDLMLPMNGFIMDVKSCRSMKKRIFQNQIAELRYDLSAYMYCHVAELIDAHEYTEFWYLAIQKKPYVAVGLYRADGAMMETGEHYYNKYLDQLAECVSKNKWPSYQEEAEMIGPPDWCLAQVELEKAMKPQEYEF